MLYVSQAFSFLGMLNVLANFRGIALLACAKLCCGKRRLFVTYAKHWLKENYWEMTGG